MVEYVTLNDPGHIFDPAVGAGAFFCAAKSIAAESRREIACSGTELDPDALEQARYNGLSADDLAQVEIDDFVLNPPEGPFKAIVANPPYIRHHRLSNNIKEELRRICALHCGNSSRRTRRATYLFPDSRPESVRQSWPSCLHNARGHM